jgi:hypothetical protein
MSLFQHPNLTDFNSAREPDNATGSSGCNSANPAAGLADRRPGRHIHPADGSSDDLDLTPISKAAVPHISIEAMSPALIFRI